MGITLGIDFGTATTCVATVRDRLAFIPEVVQLAGNDYADSVVWLDCPNGRRSLVPCTKRSRVPLDVFATARERFGEYWQSRVRAQADGAKWYYWQKGEREQAMLLTYFKPELSDAPKPIRINIPGRVSYEFDPMTQSENLKVYYEEREIATPLPDTEDLTAATAALIDAAIESAMRQLGERNISLLVLGMPSLGASVARGERDRARERRLTAVELAATGKGYRARNFRVEIVGEAEAAAFGLDLETSASRVHALVVDVGAGTTDLALVRYERRAGRLLPEATLLFDSIRFAGRDLNAALAAAMMLDNPVVKQAYQSMDARSWQLLVDDDIELIKRSLTREIATYRIPFHRYAAHYDGCEQDRKRRDTLRRTAFVDTSLMDPRIRDSVIDACKKWTAFTADFMASAQERLSDSEPIVAIELVGGAFKFEPLKFAFEAAARRAKLQAIPLRFRNSGSESQTVVARGLARWAALNV